VTSAPGVLKRPEWLDRDMARIEQLLLGTAGASSHPLVAEPSTHLIKAGGKRLRPLLVMLTARAGDPGRRSTDLAAAAIELVHLATLYHDDVIDETDVRRGVPTAHSKWGTEVAVLAGDYLFACGCSLGADAGGEVPGILARAIAEVCEGQIIETGALGDPRRPVADYLGTISLKTGALFKAACELGCATSDADARVRAALNAYGEHLGLAFQMVDDLIDLVGDPDVTGKTPGTDLKEGVFTFAVLVACERDPGLVDRLTAGERALGSILPTLSATGGLRAAVEESRRAVSRAQEALDGLPPGEWRDGLSGLADAVLAQLA